MSQLNSGADNAQDVPQTSVPTESAGQPAPDAVSQPSPDDVAAAAVANATALAERPQLPEPSDADTQTEPEPVTVPADAQRILDYLARYRAALADLPGRTSLLDKNRATFDKVYHRTLREIGLPTDDEVDLAINAFITFAVDAKAGKLPPDHEPQCHSRPQNQPGVYQTLLDERYAVIDAMPAMFSAADRDAFKANAKSQLDALFNCDCKLARARKSTGTRAAPEHSGAVKATVLNPADGSPVTFDSMMAACRKIAEWYPTATSCIKCVQMVDAGGSRNARVAIDADLLAKRLPAGSVEYADKTATADSTGAA